MSGDGRPSDDAKLFRRGDIPSVTASAARAQRHRGEATECADESWLDVEQVLVAPDGPLAGLALRALSLASASTVRDRSELALSDLSNTAHAQLPWAASGRVDAPVPDSCLRVISNFWQSGHHLQPL